MSTDPYAAPKSNVADARIEEGEFIPDGRSVSIGNGWSWIASAWGLITRNLVSWILIFVVFFVIVIGLSFIPLLGAIALYFLSPILMGGVMLACESGRNGDSVSVGQLFGGFSNNAAKLAGIGLFTLLAFMAIFAIIMLIFGVSMAGMFLGSQPDMPADSDAMMAMGMGMMLAALVVMALSIPVYMALWLSFPLVVFHDYGVIQALKTSFFACLKNILPFLVFGIVIFVLGVVGALPILLGWLLVGPLFLATFYTIYRDVFHTA